MGFAWALEYDQANPPAGGSPVAARLRAMLGREKPPPAARIESVTDLKDPSAWFAEREHYPGRFK